MIHLKEAVIVEGKYDKIKLSSVIHATIIATNGFGIFKDKKNMDLIRRLAAEDGIVVLTDSDGAGFQIRAKLSSCIPPQQIKHAYIPDIFGKEKRKSAPSKEGKLGVEGVDIQVIEKALRCAGVQTQAEAQKAALSQADFYELGLCGKPDSSVRRAGIVKRLDLPERISAKALFQILGRMYDREGLEAFLAFGCERKAAEEE